jgi:hypothetical protein
VFSTLGQSIYKSQSGDMEYVGIEFKLSNYALIVYTTNWVSGRSLALSICNKSDSMRPILYCEDSTSTQSIECVSGILIAGTYRCHCKRGSASTDYNSYTVYGHVFR